MITVTQILKLVSNHLTNKTLEAFASEFAELFYDIENTGESGAIKLSYKIESKLADVTAGIASESSLENFLQSLLPSNQPIVPTFTYIAEFAPGLITLQPANYQVVAVAVGMASPWAIAGKLPEVEFGSTSLLPPEHQTNTHLPQ